jgi:hypothetical protein
MTRGPQLGSQSSISDLRLDKIPGGSFLPDKLAKAGIHTVGAAEWPPLIENLRRRGMLNDNDLRVLRAGLVLAERIGPDAAVPVPFDEITLDMVVDVLPFNQFDWAGLEVLAALLAVPGLNLGGLRAMGCGDVEDVTGLDEFGWALVRRVWRMAGLHKRASILRT